jgi:hypothetical protein
MTTGSTIDCGLIGTFFGGKFLFPIAKSISGGNSFPNSKDD